MRLWRNCTRLRSWLRWASHLGWVRRACKLLLLLLLERRLLQARDQCCCLLLRLGPAMPSTEDHELQHERPEGFARTRSSRNEEPLPVCGWPGCWLRMVDGSGTRRLIDCCRRGLCEDSLHGWLNSAAGKHITAPLPDDT